MTTLHRHLAAVWFADIVGYTSMSETNEGEAVRLAHAFQRAARDVVSGFGGRVVKSLGDGALAEFPSTEMAVRSAHAMLTAFDRAAADEGLTTSGLRIGVHVGDIAVSDDGDLYGDGVNVASRLQSAARPGEIWVSEDVWRQLRRRPELAFESRGELDLKGIGQPLQAHSVRVLDEDQWTAPADRPEPHATTGPAFLRRPIVAGAAALALLLALLVAVMTRDRAGLVPTDAIAENAAPGVAVLPFTVNDPELARWKEGMVDLLSTNLDGAGGLRAIDSRTVLARWRERVPDNGVADLPTALDIARRAGGRYGLVGSAVSSGASMRLAAELYDLESGAQLGSPQVEGSPDSIFGLVDRLSIEVLALILEQDADAPRVDLASVTTRSLPALKSFLEAEELARRGDFPNAIPAYEEAVAADSTFALAHVRLGDAYGWTEGLQAPGVREQYAAAERHSDRLPVRDADLLEVSLAYANAREGATRLAEEVSQRYPDDPGAWFLLGEVYFHLPHQSLASRAKQREPFARAVRLDPNYLPAEIHLVDLALLGADQPAADSLMAHFGPRTAGSAYGQAYAVAYRLAFGDTTTRARAAAGLDTLSFEVIRRMPGMLRHPRFYDRQQAVVREVRTRPEYAQFSFVADFYYGQALLQWGELDELEEVIESRTLFRPAEELAMTTAWFSEIPLPEELYDAYFQVGPEDAPAGPRLAAVAARALETGDRAAGLGWIGHMRTGAERLLAAGDSANAREVSGVVRALEARDAMLRGRTDEALASLESLYRESGLPPAAIWIAQILEERGETERAIRYLEQLAPNPIFGLWLGSLYEKVGRREEALEAYGWVVLAWDGADPALQPRVTTARQAIARLEGLQRD